MIFTGATCSGKTKYSLLVAKKLSLEIINADSLLFYKSLSISTAKPTKENLKNVKHHLIDFLEDHEKFNLKDYLIQIKNLIKNNHYLVVGGSIFYIQALVKGIYEEKPLEIERKKFLENLFNKISKNDLVHLLNSVDSGFFKKYSKNDFYRMKRAIFFYLSTNRAYSKEKARGGLLKNDLIFIFDIPKKEHDILIKKRIEEMIENGLLEESQKIGRNSLLKDTIGIKESLEFLEKKISLDEMIEKIFIRTRQLAKRQKNFLKKLTGIRINPLENDPMEIILKKLCKDDPK